MQAMNSDRSLPDFVWQRANEISGRVREIREDLHAHAEIRYQEFRTAKVCADELERLGIGIRTGVGQTGVVGLLTGEAPADHGTVAFRAEMDALPMDDMCGTSYESVNPGAAHLCGHDGHVAALLGAAQVLSELRDHIPGSVKFLFEPAEEMTPPGGEDGRQGDDR